MNNIIEDQIDECCSSTTRSSKNRHDNFIHALWLQAYRLGYQWNERRKAANTLERLNTDQLKDIGLTRGDIKRDYSRLFWR